MDHRRARPRRRPPRRRPELRRQRHARVPGDEPERPRPHAAGRARHACSRAPPSCATSPPATAASPSGRRTRSRARRSTCGPSGARRTLQASFLRPVFWPTLEGDQPDAEARAPFEKNLDILEAQLGDGPWVLGRDLTVADIEIGLAALPLLHLRPRRAAASGRARRLLRPPLRAPRLRRARHGQLRRASSPRRSECRPTTSSSAPAPPARRWPTASARPGIRSSSSSTAAPTGARSSRCRPRSPTR